MNRNQKRLEILLAKFAVARIISSDTKPMLVGFVHLLPIEPQKWQQTVNIIKTEKWRFVAIWANDLITQIQLNVCVELDGEYFVVRTNVEAESPAIYSITPYYSVANRFERHIHDMYGVDFIGHPDTRRWTRHQAWQENQFPLRKNFVVSAVDNYATPADSNYPFITSEGVGTCEVPVGPIHAGIIEPGHFRFQIAGEDVLNLEERLGYVHKGIEKIAEGRSLEKLMRLATRVSGDSVVAYAWATALACENALQVSVPKRANFLRAIMLERERVANHLGDFAAICNDVGFAFPFYQFMRLKELWLRLNAEIFAHRFMMDCIVVGGIKTDINDKQKESILQQLKLFAKELRELYAICEDNSSLHDRLKNTGILSVQAANELGVLGYVGKASGQKFDVRREAPYFPYNEVKVNIPIFNTGDVLSRIRVRAQEILVSLELIEKFLHKLPDGDISLAAENLVAKTAAEGFGIVEGWRGEIFVYVNISENRVERFYPRDPSWFSWPALEKLIHGNIVPDFPVCNKSINGSYSGVDL